MRANPVLLDSRGPNASVRVSPLPNPRHVPPAETKDVVLGFCHNGTVATTFMQSCFQAINWDSLHDRRILTMSSVQSAYIASSRSMICERLLKEFNKVEWLWFLDNDMIFPPNTLDMLLSVADPKERAIVGGSYPNIFDDGIHSTWLTVADDQSLHPIHSVPKSGMVKVASVGMGCTVIHRNVLEAIGREYADDPWPYFGHDVITNGDENGRLGEDVTFCLRAKSVGFSSWGLADLTLEHLKYRPLAWEN